MKKKDGVKLFLLEPCMRPALVICERVFKKYGLDFVITETVGGIHSAGSLHYYGLAIDVRNYWWNPFAKDKIKRIVKELRLAFKGYYDVVEEKNHIHIEIRDYLKYFANPNLFTVNIHKELLG